MRLSLTDAATRRTQTATDAQLRSAASFRSDDSNGDEWTSRRATEGVARLYSSEFDEKIGFAVGFVSLPTM